MHAAVDLNTRSHSKADSLIATIPSSDTTQSWEKEGPISGAPAPLQVRPHPEVGHPYLYTGHEAFHSLGYGVPVWAMHESPNLPHMHSPNGPMGVDQLGEAGYAVLRQELSLESQKPQERIGKITETPQIGRTNRRNSETQQIGRTNRRGWPNSAADFAGGGGGLACT